MHIDARLRALIAKGPSYREQNAINWMLNRELMKSQPIIENGQRRKV